MKRIILILTIIFQFSCGSACDCSGSFEYKSEFYHSDLILSGTVLRLFDKTKNSYKIDVNITNLFKGDSISEFKVYSISENFEVIENGDTTTYISDCDLHLHVGEEWLIYADKNKYGEYYFSYCSLTKPLNYAEKSEISYLNYCKGLVESPKTKFYPSKELDYPELMSLANRDYPIIWSFFIIKELKEESEIKVKIDKSGYIVMEDGKSENYQKVVKKIKEYEPFIPGTRESKIVNSERIIKLEPK